MRGQLQKVAAALQFKPVQHAFQRERLRVLGERGRNRLYQRSSLVPNQQKIIEKHR